MKLAKNQLVAKKSAKKSTKKTLPSLEQIKASALKDVEKEFKKVTSKILKAKNVYSIEDIAMPYIGRATDNMINKYILAEENN